MEVAADETASAREKRHNGIPVLAASVILVVSAIGWKLIGAGVVVHFVVLMSGVLLGVLFQQRSPHHVPAGHAAAATAPGGARRGAADVVAGVSAPASSNDSGLTASADGQEPLDPPVGGGGGGGSSTGATASPLNWVGETVEGSINWLRGSNNTGGRRPAAAAAAAAAEQSGWAPSSGGSRRRSRSTSLLSNAAAAGSADDTPVTRSAATSPTPDALPHLGAGIPQGQPAARLRVWSRTFGAGAQAQAAAAAGDAYDDDESVEDGEDGEDVTADGGESSRVGGSAGADWLVGTGLGDTR